MAPYLIVFLGLLIAACGADKAPPQTRAVTDAAGIDGGPSGPVTDDLFMRDTEGRALILRGVNAAHTAKRAEDGVPWIDRAATQRLRRDFGLNVIRLTLFWRFVEPAKGQYDDAYLARIRQILDWSAQADIHVVLDMHQDLFGFEATDSAEGDGVPAWARKTSCPAFEDRMPWFSNYFSDPVQCQFAAFWANEAGIQDTFAAMWKHVAQELGAHPAVVGVDLFNEPWVPLSVANPADALSPFYERVIPKVREARPGLRVFYEPGALSGSVRDQSAPKPNFVNMVYAPHFYPSDVFAGDAPYTTNRAGLDAINTRHLEHARREKVPLWIGEFGAAADIPGIAQFYVDLNALWGPDFIGYARWSYDSTKHYDLSLVGEESQELDHTISMLEPYAERIPGTPKSTRVDLQERSLVLALDAETGGEMVVSCPKRFCGKQRQVTAESNGKAREPPPSTYDAELGQLRITLPPTSNLRVTVQWGEMGR